MGALHEGHLSLIRKAKLENEIVVCSIYVNPTQFNDPKDFEKYPITLEEDLRLLEEVGCDVVFTPSTIEMYPDGLNQLKEFELGYLENILEGKYRPGHFQGVCNIVDRLINIVGPNKLYMGQKDYQQVAVIQRLLELNQSSVELIACPTVRSDQGLALSSRNKNLSEEQKQQALSISKGFSITDLDLFKAYLLDNGFEKIDYISCVDPYTLKEKNVGDTPYLILVAAFIGGVRLIDNKLFL